MTFRERENLPDIVVGLVCITIGTFVLGAWLAEAGRLGVIYPPLFAMPFNTALCVVLSGIAFIISARSLARLAIAIAVVVGFVATLTLLQDIVGLNFGIDTLVIEPFTRFGNGPPGRMAPNTSVCLILCAAGIIVRSATMRNERLLTALGFVVCSVAAVALTGFLIDLDRGIAWSRLVRMSPHTAICFLSLGLGLAFSRETLQGHARERFATAAAITTYFALLGFSLLELREPDTATGLATLEWIESTRTTVSYLVLLSGAIYLGLIVYSLWNARRYRRASLDLAESQEHFAAVINSAIDGIIAIDREGIILSANPASVRIFGYSRDEMIGRNVRMLMPEPYHGAHDGYIANYNRTGEAKIIGIGREVEGRRKDGTTFPIDLAVTKVALATGVIYSGVVREISERRAMIRDLAESRERLAAVIDNAVDGIISIDHQGTILTTNPACEKIFGYSGDEMVGHNVKMLMPEPYHSAHDGYVANYNQTAVAKVIGIGREVEGRRKDGSVFPLDLAVAKVELPDGVVYSGAVRDISERKRYERELLEANAELEEFAYRTSHDLRSPIASSVGLLNISRDMLRAGDHAAVDGTLARMEKNFGRLDHLIQNIIVLTRNRLMEEEVSVIRLRALVDEVLESVSHLEDFQRISIENHIDEELTIINKLSKFQVIVGNMISNAVKYHDRSESYPRIDIRAAKRGSRVRLIVEDNGIGIPSESRAHLFRMFKRLHPNRSFGSGLGLYILKKSAESLGGTACYEPKEKGSRFVIELPDGEGYDNRNDPGRR